MEYQDLTPSQQEKISDCETVEDVLSLAQVEGVELTAEQLEQIAGGRRSNAGANPWKNLKPGKK